MQSHLPVGVEINPVDEDALKVQPEVLSGIVDGMLLLLPDKFQEGFALYHDANAGLVKTARADGVNIRYAFDEPQRKYLSEYSSTGDVVANLLIGVGGNFSTDIIKCIYHVAKLRVISALGSGRSQEADDANVNVRIARYEVDGDRRLIQGLEVVGPAGKIEESLRIIMGQDSRVNGDKAE